VRQQVRLSIMPPKQTTKPKSTTRKPSSLTERFGAFPGMRKAINSTLEKRAKDRARINKQKKKN